MLTPSRSRLPHALAALVIAAAAVPVVAQPAAAAPAKQQVSKAKRTSAKHAKRVKRAKRVKPVTTAAALPAPAAAPVPAPAPTPAAPAVTSVISIGGYVFSNVTYAEAAAAYQAAVAGGQSPDAPQPVTSVQLTVTVGN